MAKGLSVPSGDPTVIRQTPPPEGPVNDESTSFLPDKSPAPDAVLQAPSIGNDASGDLQLPDQRPALQDVHDSVVKADPDHTAKVLSLADKLQQPAAYIDRNIPDAQKAAIAPNGPFFQALEKDYPGTTQFLMIPQNMAVTKDDLPNLAAHEGLIQQISHAWTMGGLQEELGFTRFNQLWGNQAGQGDYFRLGSSIAEQQGITQTDPEARAQALTQKISELQASQPEGFGIKRGIFGATSFLPQILGGLAYGGKYAIPAAGAAAVASIPTGPGELLTVPAATTVGMTAGEIDYNYKLMSGLSYDGLTKLKDSSGNPIDPSVAKIAALATGAATAGLSLVKLGAVLDSIPGGKDFLEKFTSSQVPKVLESPATMSAALQNFAKTWVTSTLHGVGAMEGITAINIGGTEAAKAASGQDFDHITAGQALQEFGDTAKDAALTFGTLAFPGSAMGLHQGVQEARKADQTRAVYSAMGDLAEKSKLRERMPDVYSAHVAELSKNTPIENVFLPVKDVESYFQSKNIDTATAMDELGATKSYQEAKATGGDIQIPTATWAEKMVGTEHYQGLRDDVKFAPDDFTPRQIQDRINESQAQFEAIAKQHQAEAEQNQKINDLQDKVKNVGDRVREQLKAAGLTAPEVRFNPELHEAFFRTLGERMGVDPEKLAERFPLQIGNGEEKTLGQDAIQPEAIDATKLKNPEEAVEELGTKERADRLESQMIDQHADATKSINDAGGISGASSRDILRKKDAEDVLKAIAEHREKLPNEKDQSLEQSGNTEARGRIRFGTQGSDRIFHIDLLKNADKSTFLHETGHYFLEVMGDLAHGEDAHPEIKKDYGNLLKWLGVDKREDIGTEQHEKFARGFEQYLREGNAPSPVLRKAFGRFRDWLVKLYKDMKSLKVELTPEVRGIMDRMLASKDEVELAQARIGSKAEDIPGISPEVQSRIQSLHEQARDVAETTLVKEQMKEMEAKREEFLNSERERLRDEAETQVGEMPIHKASDEAVATIGKQKKAGTIAEHFLSDKLKPNEAGKFEALAQVHGFASGDEMAHSMILAEEGGLREKEIQSRVDAGMAQHADLRSTDQIKLEAMKAVHNEKMSDLLALERQTLLDLAHKAEVKSEVARRNRISAAIESKMAKDQASKMLADKPIREAGQAGRYMTAERQAAVRVSKALAKGDYEAAAQAKREQMLNHALVSEALKNQDRIEKTLDSLKKFQNRKKDLLNMPYGFIRQIDGILAKFGLGEDKPEDVNTLQQIAKNLANQGHDQGEIANRTGIKEDGQTQESLADFVARQNETYHAVSLPDSVMSGTKKSYQDLKLGDLRDVNDAVKTIAHLGQSSDRYLGQYETMDIKQAASTFANSVREKFGTPFADDLLPGSQHSTKFQEMLSTLSHLPATFDRVLDTILTTCHKLDGLEEGPAKTNIYRPFEMAESRRLARTSEAIKELDGIFAAHYKPEEFAKYKDTRIQDGGRYFTKEEILSMALNWGNEGNRQRLMDGLGFGADRFQSLFKNLGKKDWDFAQSTWDHIDKYWPEIAQLEMEVNGVEPGKVKSEPFFNEHGKYDGGYYPIKYDFNRSADAFRYQQQKDALYKQFGTAKASTDQGHTQARVTNVNRPLMLSLDVLREHHENVIHDLEMRRPVIDVSRFLAQPQAKAALTEALGVKGYSAINDWLKAAAGGGGEPLTVFDKAAQWFRFKTTFFNLAYRMVSTPKIAIENMVNLSSELGMSGAARAVKDYYMGDSGTHELVIAKSDFMRMRATHLDRDMSDLTDKWKGEAQSSFRRFAFFVHAYLDHGVSFPLWSDTYQRGMSEHGNEQLAVNQADESVKRTFMTGSKVDQAAFMRGPEKAKVWTTAYGYQSMMWNRFSQQRFRAGMEWTQGNPLAASAVAARSFVYTFALPAVTAALVGEFMRNNQNTNPDEQRRRITSRLIEEGTPLKMVPILRDLSSYFIHKTIEGHSSDLHTTPLEQAAQTLLDPMADIGLHIVGGKPLPEKFPERFANSVSLLTGVPKQFNDTVFNFLDWQRHNGEMNWRYAVTRRTKQ